MKTVDGWTWWTHFYPSGTILRRWKRNWFDLWSDGRLVFYNDQQRRDMEDDIHMRVDCINIRSSAACQGTYDDVTVLTLQCMIPFLLLTLLTSSLSFCSAAQSWTHQKGRRGTPCCRSCAETDGSSACVQTVQTTLCETTHTCWFTISLITLLLIFMLMEVDIFVEVICVSVLLFVAGHGPWHCRMPELMRWVSAIFEIIWVWFGLVFQKKNRK